MTELEKIAYTKMFIDKLANGINPLDDSKINNNDLLKNKRISNCMSYVSNILNQILENGGIRPSEATLPFNITSDELKRFEFSEEPITISEICNRINKLTEPGTKRLVHQDVTSWLLLKNALYEEVYDENKKRKIPTEIGYKIGIITEMRMGSKGEYKVVLYNKKAQAIILKYMNEIIELKNK